MAKLMRRFADGDAGRKASLTDPDGTTLGLVEVTTSAN
jgi:hypothetical protein